VLIPPSPAAERNKTPLLQALRPYLVSGTRVLEIGSGTAVHAAYFCHELEGLHWQMSNPSVNNANARQRAREHDSLLEPIDLDLLTGPWPDAEYDCVFSANVLHIAPEAATAALFAGAAGVCHPQTGRVILYGPWRYADKPLEPGNVQFDATLRAQNPESGLRLFEDADAAARDAGFRLEQDLLMPANNHLLVFNRAA